MKNDIQVHVYKNNGKKKNGITDWQFKKKNKILHIIKLISMIYKIYTRLLEDNKSI